VLGVKPEIALEYVVVLVLYAQVVEDHDPPLGLYQNLISADGLLLKLVMAPLKVAWVSPILVAEYVATEIGPASGGDAGYTVRLTGTVRGVLVAPDAEMVIVAL